MAVTTKIGASDDSVKTYTVTPGSGYTLTDGYAQRLGKTVFLNIRISKKSSNTNTTLATIPTGVRPIKMISVRVPSDSGTAGAPIIVYPDGVILTVADAAGDLRIVLTYFTNDPI